MERDFDFVVVGGGSSGCVVAGRLAQAGFDVLLLECGEAAEDNPETLRADGYKDAFANDRVIWERFSIPQHGCAGKSLFMGSGRGLGGSGAVNAMVYLRASEADFAAWNVPGWSWRDVVLDYEGLEHTLGIAKRDPTRFTEACIESAVEAGFERADDLNDGRLIGRLGYEWMNYRGNDRRSSYVAFVRPREGAANLVVVPRARAHRLAWNGDGKVVGVEYEDRDGLHTARARREVILCAGAIETPKLLMLSGIGPGAELRRHGLRVRRETEQVGGNFQDHPNVTLFYRGRETVDANYPQLYGFHRAAPDSDLPRDSADTCYVFYPARSSLREALIRMLPPTVLPIGLYRATPLPQTIRGGVRLMFRSTVVRRAVEHIYGIVVILGKPKSRGTIRLASTNVNDVPVIDPAYFTDSEDMRTMIRGVRLARRIADGTPLKGWGNTELFPSRLVASDKAIESFVRGNVMTTYHYAGTCRMGEDEHSVVDSRLRVRGVPGLRVADASVIPVVPVSALNAPSMLVGWRAASFAREESS